MNEIAEKYLAKMLEGAESGVDQIGQAIEQVEAQLEGMRKQQNELIQTVLELKELLGLEDEVVASHVD